MRQSYLIYLLIFLFSCSKEKVPVVQSPPAKQWEKFVGNYKVYDTLGTFLFDANITHYSSLNEFGVEVDSILIQNFADTMDLKFQFSYNTNINYFQFQFHDSITDYNVKSWHVSIIFDDISTTELENELRNDTMVLYFKMTNLPYYINESVPYFDCNCKHVYLKQH